MIYAVKGALVEKSKKTTAEAGNTAAARRKLRPHLMGALPAVWGVDPPGIDAIRSVSFQ